MKDAAWDDLKGYLKSYVESITEKSKGSDKYVCPFCGSGHGKNGTGALSIKDGTSWKCFVCDAGGDVFDLIGMIEHIDGRAEQLKRAKELFGVQPAAVAAPAVNKAQSVAARDYSTFFLEAHSHIGETDYLKRRGISPDVMNRFKIGYTSNYNGDNPTARGWDAIIIPTSRESYSIRNTAEDASKGDRYRKQGGTHLFNRKAIAESQRPIFVVEGEIDALSVIEVGGEAVAIGNFANSRVLLEALGDKKPTQPFIIALDNETEPEKIKTINAAAEKFRGELMKRNIPCVVSNPYGQYKDANEALQNDREMLARAVHEAELNAQNVVNEAEKGAAEEYRSLSTINYLQGFLNGISNSVNTPYISSGFKKLDKALDGGFYEGLYILGAITSLGKTTFLMQIADQIAQSGKDVMIISLEMARTEIMARSISRHTIQQVLATGGDARNAKTIRGITNGAKYAGYNEAEKELIKSAITEYGKYAEHLYIIEGVGDVGIVEVKKKIEEHIRYTGNTPVLIVDYIQILAPYNERFTDKQNTDKAVIELKRISRDFKTPVIGISSFNRDNYTNAVNTSSFKESGAIEYSSDVLIGLQLKGAGTSGFDADKAMESNPREIELKIIKNRNGATKSKVDYNYYAMFNFYNESE